MVCLPVGLEEVAPKGAAPTLVIHRRDGQLVHSGGSRRLASLIPDAELCVLEGDNHWLLFDDPGAPAFVRTIDGFTGVD